MNDPLKNGTFVKTLLSGGILLMVAYAIGFGIYIVNKLDDINKAAADIKQHVAVLEFKVDTFETATKTRTEDRYTGRDAARDRAEFEKRFQALERKK